MELLILYLGLAFAGYLVGNKILIKGKKYKWVTNIQMISVIILIFTMGARIGADKNIVAGIGSIGLTSAVITVFTMAGSVIMVFLLRKILKTDKRGIRTNE